jgi:hypothetical protein
LIAGIIVPHPWRFNPARAAKAAGESLRQAVPVRRAYTVKLRGVRSGV